MDGRTRKGVERAGEPGLGGRDALDARARRPGRPVVTRGWETERGALRAG